jgi:two-component system chemotaxis sensor kinase CheA
VNNGKKVSFEIDAILGQQQVVLKKLGPKMSGLPGVIAGAILGNGEPGLILNLNDFVEERILNHAA